MTTPTASSRPNLSAQDVAKDFVGLYYHVLHNSPDLIYHFYQETSTLSGPDPSGCMTNMTSIYNMICSLDRTEYKAEITTTDARNSYKEGVIVLVSGCLTTKDTLRRKFVETFFLAPHDKGYYVLNDIFRFVEESESKDVAEVATVVEDTPSSTLTQDQDHAQAIDPPKPERPANLPKLNENHAPVAEELITSASLEDTPKKSYASIVSSQTKKGPAKVYVPTNPLKVASAKTEKQSVNPVSESSISGASGNRATVNVLASDDAQDKVEGHLIYIRNLPVNITVAKLEAEFAKFGPIKHNGVRLSNIKVDHTQQGFSFGYVDFQDFSSMQSAIKASPITIGGNQATAEILRTTAGAGRFRYPMFVHQGGFPNENLRGRGNFSGGQSSVRSDNIRGRGNSSSGRGGESHQQGRGQGGRRPNPN